MDLSITEADDSSGRHVITLTGSLDLASRRILDAVAANAVAAPAAATLVINMSQVNFFDSAGIGALIELAGDAEDAGVAFVLQDPSARVRRVLSISGLLDSWPIESTNLHASTDS